MVDSSWASFWNPRQRKSPGVLVFVELPSDGEITNPAKDGPFTESLKNFAGSETPRLALHQFSSPPSSSLACLLKLNTYILNNNINDIFLTT